MRRELRDAHGTERRFFSGHTSSTFAALTAMSTTWTLRHGDRTIMEMPRVALLRTILLNHSIHHRGQLTVYLRLLEVPLPAVYGPSADENPFG